MRVLPIVFSALLLSASLAAAQPYTYENERFGTSATFPAEIFTDQQEPPENGDGLRWLSKDGASIAIYGSYNVLDDTPATLEAQAKADKDRKVTYSKTGRNWVVTSGTEGNLVFYKRRVFGPTDIVHGIEIKYPASLKDKYDPIVGTIAGSLRGP